MKGPDPTARKGMAARLTARREALRERLRKRRGTSPPRRRRRRGWWLAALLLLVLLLAWLCCSGPTVPPVEPEPPATASGAPHPPAAPVVVPAPLTGRVERRDRPDFPLQTPEPLPWLASFRLQVTSRSPRLSSCFDGAVRPGSLKWTASVEPDSGRISDATVEPTLQSDPLNATQRACVLEVLSEPPYQLEPGGDERTTPSRVSIAIEF